ncbi:putative endonuclease lcl3 [Tulasnella sp. 427]|nr:putative endonuclease lcl3 [Tulasnella sp. 427]
MDKLPSVDEIKKKTLAQAESLGLTTLSPVQQAAVFALLGSAGTFGLIAARKRFWRRIQNSDYVPATAFEKRRWVKGDGDNFRLYHTPGLFWRWPLKLRRVPTETKGLLSPVQAEVVLAKIWYSALKDQTLHIRMAGADAPEAAHFGKPGQPGAEEARLWLENKILGKRLWCQLVYRDQYRRTVAVPHYPYPLIPYWISRGRNLSLMMLSAGWASVYEQANAEYGKAGKEAYVRAQDQAQKARRGMWAKGTNIELPSQFKKRVGIESSTPTSTSTLRRASAAPSKSIFSWFRRS